MKLHFLKSMNMTAVMRVFFLCVLVSGLAGTVCSPAQAAVYYVKQGATGLNDGTSWGNAFTGLQSALTSTSLLSGDEIWVAAGTYSPGISSVDSFSLVQGVGIYGGFSGTETSLSERNWTGNVTILNGVNGGNSNEHVVRCSTVDSSAVLDGFTIRGGASSQGGGLYNSGGSPTIRNCIFTANGAAQGAGIYNNGGSPTIENCTFTENTAFDGAGIYNNGGSPTIENCTFTANTATDIEGGGIGGGIFNYNSSPIIKGCTFSGNSAFSYGGGIHNEGSGNPSVNNCTFSGNTANSEGGGVFNYNSILNIRNSTFIGNIAPDNGGGIFNTGTLTVYNTIVADNSGSYDLYNLSPGTVTSNYNIVESMFDYPSGINDIIGNQTSLNIAPLADNGGPTQTHALLSGSIAIDAGNPSATDLPSYDQRGEGFDRVKNGRVDIGAYEIDPPDMNISQSGTSIARGGSFDFGDAVINTDSVPVVFLISNTGTADLLLSGTPSKISISGTNALEFVIDETSLISPIPGSGNSTFSVTFTPVGEGIKTASIFIANNDADENPYVVNLTGTGTAVNIPPVILHLDGDMVTYTGLPIGLDQGNDAAVTDANNSNFIYGYLSAEILGGDANDVLEISNDADGDGNSGTGIFADASNTVFYNNIPVGYIGIDFVNTVLKVFFETANANADAVTAAMVGDLIRAVRYSSTVAPTGTASKSVSFKLYDGAEYSLPATVTVSFGQRYRLTVSISGSGSVSGSGIACPSDCYEDFPAGEIVSLTAYPYSGYILSGWSGVMGSSGNSASVKMDSDKVVTVIFIPDSSYPPDPYPTDLCPYDPNKTEPGICGCGVADTDTDGDGTADCKDNCPNDPAKTEPGICGCGVSDTDTDGDGLADCKDQCPTDSNKTEPGICGCGVSDTDTDGDGTADCKDQCLNDPAKTEPGICGCGISDADTDGDGTADCKDQCLNDPAKTEPGICGCGVADADTDGDGTSDCKDQCLNDAAKTEPGICGCGVSDADTDGDGTADCKDLCPDDPDKTAPGVCGCGISDADKNGDGSPDCINNKEPDPPKPLNPKNKIYPPGPITLKTAPYSDPEGDTHLETLWVVYRTDNSCGETVEEHASATDLTEYTVTGLLPGLRYGWKAGFRDSGSSRVSWSEEQTLIVGENVTDETVRSNPGTQVSDYRMFSFPYLPEDPASETILSGMIGESYDTRYFRIGTYDPQTGEYIEYGPDLEFEPGRAYWFLTRNGGDIPQTGAPVTTGENVNVKLGFDPSAGGGWNMVAAPNSADYLWYDVEIVIGSACKSIRIADLPEDNPYISKKLWQWNEDGYSSDADRLEKGKGYWVKVKQQGIWLKFRADKQIMLSDAKISGSDLSNSIGKRIWRKMAPDSAHADEEDSPPMPPGGFAENGNSADSGGGGGCFIRTAREK